MKRSSHHRERDIDMSDILPKEFRERNLVNPMSPAFIVYQLNTRMDVEGMLKVLEGHQEETEETLADREIIRQLSDPDDFFKWMRRRLAGRNKFLLREVMLANEETVAPMIRKRIPRSMVDDFVECAVDFFIHCKEDPSGWILENYKDIRNPYTQSLLCLVLGFRGDQSCEAFLLEEALRLDAEYPEDTFEQGPLIAMYMLEGLDEYLTVDEPQQ